MSEIRVGEYVRNKNGALGKITKVVTEDIFYVKFYDNIEWKTDIEESGITKHSFNIIDLIEEGDYVNGEKITEITIDPFVKGQINLWTDVELRNVYEDYERVKYTDKDIKSIVTKEQFKDMEYKVC